MNKISSSKPVLIAAGGTGGHVYPALVVAEVLRNRGVAVIWVGTRRGIEARVVPDAGLDIEWLDVSGLRGKSFLHTVSAPIKILHSVWQSVRLFIKYKPIAVLGMGGFVTGPVGLAARLMGKPLVLHEQNAIPGMTNRWLSNVATKVLQAFPGAFAESAKTQTVGNPLRPGIAQQQARKIDHDGIRVLVVGGSLGAKFFNEIFPDVMADLGNGYSVRHQTGKGHKLAVEASYQRLGLVNDAVEVFEFIEDMQAAYAWADLVVCRSGAMTISELSAAGCPSILVPYPFAVDDHQTKNAMFLVKSEAAVIMQQSELSSKNLSKKIIELSDQSILVAMGNNARKNAVLDAGDTIADILLEVAA